MFMSFAACGARQSVTTYSPVQIAEVIVSAQANLSKLYPLTPDDDYYEDYLSGKYQINSGAIKDGVICYADGMQADTDGMQADEISVFLLAGGVYEISVFLLADGAYENDVKDALKKYIRRRAGIFMKYSPYLAAILENGVVATNGDYVALLICEDVNKAESLFNQCFSDNPPKIPDKNNLFQQVAPEYPVEPNGKEEPNPETEGKTVVSDSPEITDAPVSEDGPGIEGDAVPPENPGAPEGSGTPGNQGTPETSGIPEGQGAQEDQGTSEDTDPPEDPATSESPVAPEDPAMPVSPDDVYDHDAVLSAWRKGDNTALAGKNRSVYNVCTEIIDSIISDDMSGYEKELAIHDWIIDWANYDVETMSNSPNAKPDPDNDNPYGLLLNKKAICSGFTSTFQLFMDMLGVECITVNGTNSAGEEHAWNMVRLEGEWYCVDVTWDNPIDLDKTKRPAYITHEYFNVTSQHMWNTGHRWDKSVIPEATALKPNETATSRWWAS
jgi:hypothetical protein